MAPDTSARCWAHLRERPLGDRVRQVPNGGSSPKKSMPEPVENAAPSKAASEQPGDLTTCCLIIMDAALMLGSCA